jgi:hypothetical protein
VDEGLSDMENENEGDEDEDKEKVEMKVDLSCDKQERPSVAPSA